MGCTGKYLLCKAVLRILVYEQGNREDMRLREESLVLDKGEEDILLLKKI